MRDRADAPLPACPICGAPRVARWRPFCSKRCADLDLGRWMTEAYSAPSEEGPPDDPAERAAFEAALDARRRDPSTE